MTSDRRQAANRLNAQRSTGPKSAAGKRAAALNAIRHGLTARTILDVPDPALDQIHSVILPEIKDPEIARSIAQKILNYERNEAYQRQIAEAEKAGQNGFVDQMAIKKNIDEGNAQAFIMAGQVLRKLEQPRLSKTEKAENKLQLQSLRFLAKVSAQKADQMVRDGKQKETQMRRHYKRASNQLIKAVKAASLFSGKPPDTARDY
ncbi:hypothetical protein [Orrella daihaiensis]|uniref:Uncharacterized protein n=1 Tax=Orrella daihaiensis TaxID=2782176 RepID=A0ABY4AM84_9BURK|nr:hypothetical protein [Orrella daihaiensis]UOD51435.1 hypothetical protein DHf2319_06315 [Orrella daihaiensis]